MNSPSLRKYLAFSAFFHIAIVGLLLLGDRLFPPTLPKETVNIEFLTPEQLQQAENLEKVLEAAVPANQIVEQSETSANETPVETRFLGPKDQKVEKQTVAAQRGQFQNKQTTAQKAGPRGDRKEKSSLKSKTEEKIAKDLFKTFDPVEALERQKLADRKTGLGEGQGEGDAETGTHQDVSQTNDYIKDVDTGLKTMLNTREFKYYSYYNRIRRQLSQHWEGRVREKLSKMFKEGRAPAATQRDRITKLMIILNDKGTLVRVQVVSDSGVRDLDEAAIEAFRAAAPFPNPPKGIVESDGTVKIRWDFVLET